MSYVTPSDFRATTLAEYAQGLALTADDINDTKLALAITRLSGDLDDLTNDHFESASATYDLSGDGSSMLSLPQRCTAVSTVKTRDYAGTLTTQAATTYRLVSSLDSTGATRISRDAEDYIAVVPGQYLSLSTGTGTRWPTDTQTVQVVGTFGWTVTPPKIKRALALMVYDDVKPMSPILRKTQTYRTADAEYTMVSDGPTGIPEADRIIKDYTRGEGVLVG